MSLIFTNINARALESDRLLSFEGLVAKAEVIAHVKFIRSSETMKPFHARHELPYIIHEFEVIKPLKGAIKEHERFILAKALVKTTTRKPSLLLELKQGEEFLVFFNNQDSFSYTETSGKEVTKKRLMIIDPQFVFSASTTDEHRELKRINELFNSSLTSVKEFIEKIRSVTKRKHEK
jgi:hypothetical protein